MQDVKLVNPDQALVQSPPRSTIPLAFLLVVIGPATFWSGLTFAVCLLAGMANPVVPAMLVFALATVVLTGISGIFNVRI